MDDITVSIVSYQEQVLGWMAEVNAARSAEKSVGCYERLKQLRLAFELCG
ncbi:MAG: hypothetical protein ACKV2Q_07200 [Planctomycetaceae bacterium]